MGTTLWFPDIVESRPYRRSINDFHLIRDFIPWVFEKNEKAVRFLDKNVRLGDVVVTHHLPAERSIATQYKGQPTNAFFYCKVDPLVEDRGAAVWVHGHTHEQVDYLLGKTRVVCNPFGYPREGSVRKFQDRLIIQVG